MQQQVSVIPCLPFAADIWVEALYITLYIPHQTQLQVDTDFPNPIPASLGSYSTYWLGHLLLLPSLVPSLFGQSFVRSSLLTHTGLLLPLLDFMLIGIKSSRASELKSS